MASLLDLTKNLFNQGQQSVQRTVNPILQRVQSGYQSWQAKPSNQLVNNAYRSISQIRPITSQPNMNPQVSNPILNLINVGKMQLGSNYRNFVNTTALNQANYRADIQQLSKPGSLTPTYMGNVGKPITNPFEKKLTYGMSQQMGFPRDVALGLREPTKEEVGQSVINSGGISGGLLAGQKALGFGKATQFSSLLDKKPRFEISDRQAFIKPKALEKVLGKTPSDITKAGTRLGQIFDHKGLYTQYPEFKNLRVYFEALDDSYNKTIPQADGTTILTRGSFDPDTFTLKLDPRLTKSQMRSTILHETQHGLQKIEGFAVGGNVKIMNKPTKTEQLMKQEMDKTLESVQKLQEAEIKGLPQIEVYSPITGKVEVKTRDSYATLMNKWFDEYLYMSDKYASEGGGASPFNKYSRLSGELEARAVQRREGMSPALRAKTDPYAAEALATTGTTRPSDFITRFDNETPSLSRSQPPSTVGGVVAKKSDFINNPQLNEYGFVDIPNSGIQIHGKPMDITQYPEVYHVTTNAPAVEKSGVIRVGAGSGGLGGHNAGAVSFTVDAKVAKQIQDDLKLSINAENMAKDVGRQEAKQFIFDQSPPELQRFMNSVLGDGVVLNKDYSASDVLRAYFQGREKLFGVNNPIMIGSEGLAGKNPNDVKILKIDTKKLNPEVLTTNFDIGKGSLEEARYYGDVPLVSPSTVGGSGGNPILEQVNQTIPTTTKKGNIEVKVRNTIEPQANPMVSGNVKPQVGKQIKLNQPQIQSSGSILPQRGFAKSVSENKKTPEILQSELEKIRYTPITNKESLNFADKLIKKNESEAFTYATSNSDTNANATAVRLIEKYINTGRYAEARALTEQVSPRFTKAGQEIQILSAYGRLTPTGAIRYAQQLINEANKANPRLNLKLTDENTKIITDYAKRIKKLPEGSRERTIAVAQLMQAITDTIPSSIGQKLSTIQTMAQLLNPKTFIRNILGNTIFTGTENVSDVLGTGIDRLVSAFTGKRSKVLPSLRIQGQGFKRGLKEGVQDVKLGINTSPGNTKFDLTGKTFNGKILGNTEKLLNYELRVPDRAAYTAAYDGSLNNQMRAAGVSAPTDQMKEIAHSDALYRTFQDNSKLAQFFSGVKKVLNKLGTPDGKFGLGDFILKYPRTPANILSRGLDYSPIGYVKAIYEATHPLISGQPFNQKSFVEALSRATTGAGIIATGYLLAKNGIITGKPEKDYDISSVQRTTGQGAFKLNVDALKRYWLSGGQKQDAQNGDTLVSYDWAQPTALALAMGANQALGGGSTGAINAVSDSLQSSVDTITGQPMIKGLMDFATGIKNKGVVGATTDAVLGSVSGFVPSIVRQVSNVTDTTQRNTYAPDKLTETMNKVKANIPGLRNTLQPKLDVFGKEMPNYEGGTIRRLFDIFVNPAFVTKVEENPAAKEVLDIYQRSGETQQAPRVAPEKVKINGETIATTPEQYTQYQRYIGTKSDEAFNKIVQDPVFQRASDEDKAKLLASVLTDINSAAKIEIFGNQPKTVDKNVKKIIGGGTGDSVGYTKDGNLKLTGGDIVKPELTGNALLDKKLISAYNSEINTAKNDIVELYKQGVLTADEAEKKLSELSKKSLSSGKGKKITIKNIKPKKLTFKAIKLPKVKIIKMKSPKTKKYKVKKLPSLKLAKAKKLVVKVA